MGLVQVFVSQLKNISYVFFTVDVVCMSRCSHSSDTYDTLSQIHMYLQVRNECMFLNRTKVAPSFMGQGILRPCTPQVFFFFKHIYLS